MVTGISSWTHYGHLATRVINFVYSILYYGLCIHPYILYIAEYTNIFNTMIYISTTVYSMKLQRCI